MEKELKAEFPKARVSWRAQRLSPDGKRALALAYVDARDVMNRLDEVCGFGGWQCRYSHANGKTVCDIGIKLNDEWIWKADGAGDTDVEAEKGALSDAFKRAAVRWGIGRYLYDMPANYVPCETYTGNDGKKRFSKFTADPWDYVNGKPYFSNSSKRKEWLLSVTRQVNSAKDIKELDGLLKTYAPEISALEMSKNEYDQIALKELQNSIQQRTELIAPIRRSMSYEEEVNLLKGYPPEDDRFRSDNGGGFGF